jgi:long-chain acyl-CoA synthetase
VGLNDGGAALDGSTDGSTGVNLAHIIDGHPADHPALISANITVSYGELRSQVACVRGGLAGLGVGEGDRVAIIAGNGIPFVVTYLAAVGLGAVIVPLNPASPAAELTRQLRTVAATVVLVGRGVAGVWRGVDAPSVEHVVAVEAESVAGAVAWSELLAAEPVEQVVDVAPSHLAVLMFTSGTAGAPRAAMLTHGNLLANQRQVLAVPGTVSSDDVVYGVLPLFHVFGLNVTLGLTLAAGGTLLLVQRFDPATAIESIRARKVTAVPGVPSMWAAFAHFDEAPADAFATVRRGSSGAAKLPVAVAERIRDRFGLELSEGYGLTEAAAVVSTSAGLPARFGSVGRVVDGVDVRVVDEQGDDVLVGDAGEVWVRGENVFAGYLDDPEATARVLSPDGWLRTGDVAMLDEDGFMYLVDRAKDQIIVSGFNVFPAEVEDVLTSHPDVAEAGVIGVAHPHTGEAVKAYVVAEPGAALDEDGLIEFARDHLARYKCPSKVIFVDKLPRNAAGKLVRRRLSDDDLLTT